MPLASQVAVVTGSSTGIGAALARRLAARGLRVGLIALPNTGLESVADSIRAKGGIVATAEADLGDRSAIRDVFSRIAEQLAAPIDLLVLNAGRGGPSPIVEGYADRVEPMFRVNVIANAYAIEAVVPGMIARGGGRIVGVSSLSSFRGQPLISGYCASKAGFSTLLEGLRIELKRQGIAVTIVRPGFVRTPMTADVPQPRLIVEPEEAARIIDQGIAAGRSQINFPTRASIAMKLFGCLPNALYDRLAKAAILDKYEESAR